MLVKLGLTSATAEIQHFIYHHCRKKGIKPCGRKAYSRTIRCFFNWAYNPASGLGLKPSDHSITRVKPPNGEQKVMPVQDEKSLGILSSHVLYTRDKATIPLLSIRVADYPK